MAKNLFISPNDTLRTAMEVIDKNSLQICFVVDASGKLVGAVTDGDIRRAILKSAQLDHPIHGLMNKKPKFIGEKMTRSEILEKMRIWDVRHLPVLDEHGKIIRIETSDDIIGLVRRTNRIVLMAGGFGKRLSPLTDTTPKPLLRVGGYPILEIIVRRFRDLGFYNFVFVVNYRSEMIKEHFGNGESLGISIEYVDEEKPLGTCGGLTLLKEKPQEPFFVMNGDILTLANFVDMLEAHESLNSAGTMAVREYSFEVPYGVVKIDGSKILSIEEKPIERSYVNAGIYVLSPEAWELIPKNSFFDMPSLFAKMNAQNSIISCFKLSDYWLDIGRMEDFQKAQVDFEGVFKGKR